MKKSPKTPKNNAKILKVILIILITLLGITVGTCLVLKFHADTAEAPSLTETDAARFSAEYPKVSEDNVFVYRNATQIIDILRGGTGVVFFGFPDCPWCQAYAPILNDVAKEIGLKKIFYFNIQSDRADNTAEYQTIVEILRTHLSLNDEGKPRIFVPHVSVINQGALIGHNNETSLITGGITPQEYWTTEKITSLKNHLRAIMTPVVNEGCIETCQE